MHWGTINFDFQFLSAWISIVIIDLILAGDNAVVIAMAVRSLPREQRLKGIIYGSAAAVLLRVVLTIFVARLLTMECVKLAGGIVILWIAIKLFIEDEEAETARREGANLWHAIRLIVIADVTMALDNMLAVAGASHGNFVLLLFGLALSIPFIVFTSSLLSMLIEKYAVIIYIGAAILGKVGGEMILTDPLVQKLFTFGPKVKYGIEALFAAGVIVFGTFLLKRAAVRQASESGSMSKKLLATENAEDE